jgi:hypothetical protein
MPILFDIPLLDKSMALESTIVFRRPALRNIAKGHVTITEGPERCWRRVVIWSSSVSVVSGILRLLRYKCSCFVISVGLVNNRPPI